MSRRAGVVPGLLLICVSACGRGTAISPLEAQVEAITDPRTREVVAAMYRGYGGHDAWSRLRNVEYTYSLLLYGGPASPRAAMRQIHRFGLGPTPQAYVEDLDGEHPRIVRLNGPELHVTRGGVPVSDTDRLDFPRAYSRIVRWAFLNPWNLLDAGVRLESRSPRTPQTKGAVPAGMCDVLRLRFEGSGPLGDMDDWHDFYVSRRSRLVEQVHSYRAADNTYRLAIWSDHRTHSGVRVASRRETHASDAAGSIGPLEAVAEYIGVRFDGSFGNEMFRDDLPAAAPSTRTGS